MATFADYNQHTMAGNDFTLYPYQEVWNQDQSYLPTSTYADQTYLNATSFDSYQAQQTYTHPDQFTFPLDPSFQQKHSLHPDYSPAHSASHSFDQQNPPFLSSTSDSGASVQSTISSAMGSPSAQPQQSNDWAHPSMGMFPGIVNSDGLGHDAYATTGFEMDSIPVTDKGCVGELTAISSSQMQQNMPPFNMSSFNSSFDLLRDAKPFPQAFGGSEWSVPQDTLPQVSAAQSLSIPSAFWPEVRGSSESASPNDSVFKSPTTPASASATSPVLERIRGKRKTSIAYPPNKRARGHSPLTQAMSYDETQLPQRPQAPPPTLSSPFFTQSSGHFVPPLDYSCPSISSPVSYFLDFWRQKFENKNKNSC